MNNKFDFSAVDTILTANGNNPIEIIPILQEIQKHYNYIPREVFPLISKRLGISEAKIYSIATFYDNFSIEPKGKYVIKVCDGTACHVRHSIPILEKLRSELGLSAKKKTTDDLLFTVETVACLGACGLAPVIKVNDKIYPSMTPEKAVELLKDKGMRKVSSIFEKDYNDPKKGQEASLDGYSTGKYILSVYQVFSDVRLVGVPPESIGNWR